jgi:hypothetical protein
MMVNYNILYYINDDSIISSAIWQYIIYYNK